VRRSQKADYALRAALDLALQVAAERPARTAEIARRTGAPVKFLEAVLGHLRRAGLVDSQRGRQGGHRLSRPPARISAGEVWRAVDGPIGLAARTGRRRAPSEGPARAVDQLWTEVEGVVQRTVDGVSLEDLARRSQEISSVPDFSI